MEEIAQVYARALFEVATEQDALDEVREQLGAFADAMHENRDLAVFFFSPVLLGRREEGRAGARRSQDAHPAVLNFLEALIERHRMPAIFRIRDRVRGAVGRGAPAAARARHQRGRARRRRSSTSLGKRIGEQVDREVEISSEVDPDILGGVVLRVGNVILDASIKNRLEQLRKQVAQA